ncbi:MAG TPA: hypothetical protein PKC69_05410 [Chitinophagaceae bacterium]|nr:hypothetical protein [Chitinophagaceae bacterium]
MADNSHVSTVLNKILIPVITTVLGATAIYFLGFNRKGGGGRSEMEKLLITKEATIKAWKSFVTAQNISYKNSMSISEEYNQRIEEASREVQAQRDFSLILPSMNAYRDELVRESRKGIAALEDILSSPDIDPDFISMIKRAIDNSADQEKKVVTFFTDLGKIAKSDMTFEEKGTEWQNVSNRLVQMADGIEKRAATEAEDIAKILSERYSQAFDLNQLQVYVDYKKERAEKNNDPDDNEKPAPRDPREGIEYKPGDDEPEDDKKVAKNETVTKAWLTGEWSMVKQVKGYMELSANGDLYWEFENKGYTSGKWRLDGGRLRMDAVNPETQKKHVVMGEFSDVTQNSFTLTLKSVPREIYYFKRK